MSLFSQPRGRIFLQHNFLYHSTQTLQTHRKRKDRRQMIQTNTDTFYKKISFLQATLVNGLNFAGNINIWNNLTPIWSVCVFMHESQQNQERTNSPSAVLTVRPVAVGRVSPQVFTVTVSQGFIPSVTCNCYTSEFTKL